MADETFEVELRIDLNSADLRGELSRSLGELNNSVTGFDKKIAGVQKTLDGTAAGAKNLSTNLSTTRYALYDVSSSLAVTGAALLGLTVASTAVAVAWERDFAQVVRTTGVTGSAIQYLRDDLVDLAQTMPVAFGDITQIATLGGQLGVAQDRIVSFTETVAKFSAVTDLTVDAAATAFGRLDALLPDVQGNYEALGSAIAQVGVNSVATESQIVAISTQISSMGAFAGLTADEVVGLSGALASVGAAPELSRGTVTRVFTEMSEAIAEGGDKLGLFAKVAGVSADQFAGAFGTARFGPIFQSFIEGLNDSSRSGENVVQTLDALGIQSVRDVPLLLRLAGAGDLLASSFQDASEGFDSAGELQRQYAIIAETTASRIQVLAGNFGALMDALGSANLGPFGDILDILSGFLGMLTDIASSDFARPFIGLGAVLAGLAGVMTLAGAGLALFGASSIGIQQGLAGIVAIAPRASAAILGTGTASAIAAGEMKTATLTAKAFWGALKLLSVVGALLVLPDFFEWGAEMTRGARDVDESMTGMVFRIKQQFGQLNKSALEDAGTFGAAINRAFAGADPGVLGDIKRVDEAIAGMVEDGNVEAARSLFEDLRTSWVQGGGDAQVFETYMTDANNALKEAGSAAGSGANSYATMEEALAGIEEEARETEAALNELRDAILNLNEVGINAEQAAINLQRSLNDMADAAANADASLGGANAESLTLREAYLGVEQAARDSAAAMIDNGATAEEATAAYMEQRQAIIESRVAKGEDKAVAEAWADAVLGSAGEAKAAIEAYSRKVKEVPKTVNTRVYVDASGAYRSVDSLVAYINSRTATMTVNERTIYTSSVQSGGRGRLTMASGGPVFGPGTGTSDSIMARLSNGEYVMKAAAVDHYGYGLMNALNSMKLPKFASGGPVGRASSAPMLGGVVELGPKTLKQLSREVTNNIMLDDVAISRASQRGDSIRRSTGDL